MAAQATLLTIVYNTFGSGKVGIALFTDGRIFVSGYGCVKATHQALITFWAAVPAVVGLTRTPFGNTCSAALVPSAGDLTTIGNAALGATYINLLLANTPTYLPPFTA